MTSILIEGHSHEYQACLILFSKEKSTRSIARSTDNSIGGGSPIFRQFGPHLNRGTGSSIGGS